MFHQVTSSSWISTGGISNAGNSTLPWWWIFLLGCAISSSVADVWRRISHCVKRRNGREEGCNLWTHGPQPRYGSGLTEKRRMCLRVMISVFFSLFFVFVVFQFQIVLLLWGIFFRLTNLHAFLARFFPQKMGLHRCRASVAIMHMAHKTWGSQSPRQEFFFFFEILEEGRIHVSFIHIKTYKVEV